MNTKRATGWPLAIFMAVVLPVSGVISACNSPEAEEAGGTAEQASSNGLVQEVSADTAADRVARVTFFDGGVAARPVGAEEWETLEVNEPLFEGYEVYAEEDAHAELMLGEAKYARFGDGADVTISRLDPEFAQFELGTGVMTLALDEWSDGEYYEVNTPAGAFIPQQAGSYRVDVLPSGETRIGVLRGTAIVTTPEGQFTVSEGDAITLPYGESAQVDVVSGGYASYYDDDWDDWSYQRDVHYETYYTDYDYPAPIQAFESRNDIYGIVQLAAFGLWAALDDDDDRYVWRPHAARNPGWSPYSDGYWDYTPVTGWTWISREEWGWAPYHYGRWDYRDNYGWYWAPDHGDRISTVSVWREPYRWYPSQVYFYQPPQQNTYVYVPLAPGERYIPYGYSAYYEPAVQVYDYRPRHLRENRAVYYIDGDDLRLRGKPRRAERDDLARFARFADERTIPIAKLPRPDRVVGRNEIANERIRPPKFAKERPVVVSERAIERKARRADRQGQNVQVADRREVRKAEKRDLKVNRRQLQANEQVQPVRKRGGQVKADRARAQQPNTVDARKNGGNIVERQKQRTERRQQRKQQPQVDRQQRRAERQQQPKVDRQQRRAERQQQRVQQPKVDRQQRRAERQQQRVQQPRVNRQERQQLRQQRQQVQRPRQQERVQRQQRSVAPRAARQERQVNRAAKQPRAAAERRVAPQQRQQVRANRAERKQVRADRQQVKQARAPKAARPGRRN